MILSHMAPSCLNMSPYRAIWTHFRSNSMIVIKQYILGQVKDQVQDQVLDLGPGPRHVFGKNHGIGFEMGPYGSIWAHTKTGRGHMAQDRF